MSDFIDGLSKESWAVIILVFVLLAGLIFGLLCFEAWIGMLLWNACLVGTVAFIGQVSFWQMMGIMLLCNMLFKSIVYKKKD